MDRMTPTPERASERTEMARSDTERPAPTAADLAVIEALAAAATPGPWEWWRDTGLAEDGVHAPFHPHARRDPSSDELLDTVTICRGMTGAVRVANAQFIAAARDAIPALVAEIRRLRSATP